MTQLPFFSGRRMSGFHATLPLAVGLLLTGCSGDETEETPTPDQATPTATAAPTPTASPTPAAKQCKDDQTLIDGMCVAALPDGWTQIFPGGDSICSRGTEFSFFVHPGTVNKLVLGYDGGGACWDYTSCSKANPTFSEDVNEGDDPDNITDGLLDYTNPENPFRDWFAVFIPYCTGDIHWGDNVATYYENSDGTGDSMEIHHKGYVNSTTVLNWVYDNFESPESIFLTGVSAGSYGSIAASAFVMAHYQDSKIVQIGDCGAGVVTQDFLTTGITNWDAQKNFPIESLATADVTTLTLNDMYIAIGEEYPDQMISQYNTANDWNQRYYYELMSGDTSGWSAIMFESMETLATALPNNFRYYIAGGEKHGILPYPEFYTYAVEGYRVRDWVASLVLEGDAPNVKCTGTGCDQAEEVTPARQQR